MTKQPTAQAAQEYAEAVVRTLVGDFPLLADRTIERHITEQVARQAEAPMASFEAVVDAEILANWRLKQTPDDPHRVELVCYRLQPRAANRELERRVNTALRSIPEA